MDFFIRWCRRMGSAWMLAAALLLGGSPAAAAGDAPPAVGAARLDLCGPLSGDPGAGEGAGVSRPGEVLSPGDKGFGCRFTVPGLPGREAEIVEVRLTRPGASPGALARDRWFLPVRRGTPALAAYAFAGPGEAREGVWTLELYLADVLLAEKRFEVILDRRPDAPVASGADAASPAPAPPEAVATRPRQPEIADLPARGKVSLPATAPESRPEPAARSGPAVPRSVSTPPDRPGPGKPAREGRTPPEGTEPRPAFASGYFALQTGLFAEAGNAEGQAAVLRARGMPACLLVEGEGNRKRYRVLAGRFGDRRAALASRAEVKAASGAAPLPVRVEAEEAARLRCH